MDTNSKLTHESTHASLLPRNFKWCHRTITEVNKQYKEFLTQEYDGEIVDVVRVSNNNNIGEHAKFNQTLGLECNQFDTLCPTPPLLTSLNANRISSNNTKN